MYKVMSGIPLAHWQNVLFFDLVHGGRIYANRPELKLGAFYYHAIPGHAEEWSDPSGQTVIFPPKLPAPRFRSNMMRLGTGTVISNDAPPNSAPSGPFHRTWLINTSWIADSMQPTSFPVPVPSGGSGYLCNGDTFRLNDAGYMYSGAYANTQLQNPTEAEMGGFIQNTSPTKGFAAYMSVSPENNPQTKVGYQGFWGCLSPLQQHQFSNVIFNVVSSTEIEGVFGGYLDSRTC